jgi:hypothetical protein
MWTYRIRSFDFGRNVQNYCDSILFMNEKQKYRELFLEMTPTKCTWMSRYCDIVQAFRTEELPSLIVHRILGLENDWAL